MLTHFHKSSLALLFLSLVTLYCYVPFLASKHRKLHATAPAILAPQTPHEASVLTSPLFHKSFLEQLDVMARTVYGEARGEGEKGMEAVAHVILNRLQSSDQWGSSIGEVAKANAQFSCWSQFDPNSRLIRDVDFKDPEFMRAFQIAQKTLLRGAQDDPTKGATHFHTQSVAPDWRHSMRRTAQIGNHIFYKDPKVKA